MKEQFIEWTDSIMPWLFSHGLRILIIIVVTFLVIRVLKKIIERAVRISVVSTKDTSAYAEKKREDTLISIFSGVTKIVLITIGSMMVLQEMGVMIAPLLAGAGIVGLAFGFGGQYLIRDVIGGLFIILENQYRIGDIVSFDGTGGVVENITIRMTTIRDLDGVVHHVPHGEIKIVANLTKRFARVNMNIGVSYSSNLEHVISVINRVGKELSQDPLWKEFIITAPQFLRVDDFGDSSIVIKIWEIHNPFVNGKLVVNFEKD